MLIELERRDLRGQLGISNLKQLDTAFKAIVQLRKVVMAGAAVSETANDGTPMPAAQLLQAVRDPRCAQRRSDRLETHHTTKPSC